MMTLSQKTSKPLKKQSAPQVQVAGNPQKSGGLNICVFCSAQDQPAKYTAPTEELAKLLAERGHTLVWGGSAQGLMQVVADGVKAGGARIVGFSVEQVREKTYRGADEMTITKTLGERKAAMLAHSDVIIALVGGIGTLDEITEVIELRRNNLHDKLVIVIDTDGFYDGLRMQLERMEAERFIPRPLAEIVQFARTPLEAITMIDQLNR